MFAVERDVGTATRAVFVVGVVLRVLLACLNWEANDDHLAVSRVIADEQRIPDKDELEEAFQPKLYHFLVAALWQGVPTQSPAIRIRLAQFVSCLAGVVVLRVALRFVLQAASLSAKVRCLAFALVALNPRLIGINAQATNDSLVILFVSLSLYYGYRFFDGWRGNDFAWMTLSTILAGLSKGNGVVVFIAILWVFILACVHRGPSPALTRGQTLLYGAIFVAVYLTLVPRLGPYGDYYRRHGSPFVINMAPAPFPHVFQQTFVSRPGVTSLVHALLTFRLLDMLHTPVITNGAPYPQHRTSLWSQLYGRAHFVHFDAWPPSWQVPEGSGPWATRLVWNLGRLILLCALLPTILLLVAVVRRGGSVVRWVIKTQAPPVRLGQGLLDLAVFGYLLFIVVYALRYRSFAVMKAIFLFPAGLGFVVLFARECDRFYAWCAHHTRLRVAADSVFACLSLLYVVDVLVLIGHLGLQLWTA